MKNRLGVIGYLLLVSRKSGPKGSAVDVPLTGSLGYFYEDKVKNGALDYWNLKKLKNVVGAVSNRD